MIRILKDIDNSIMISIIKDRKLSECCDIVDSIKLDLPIDSVYFNIDTYKRFLIYRDDKYTVFLITWKTKQMASYHSHSSDGCLFKIIKGKLKEVRLDKLGNESENIIDNSSGSQYIDNSIAVHKIEALEDTISLHIYSPSSEVNRSYIDISYSCMF